MVLPAALADRVRGMTDAGSGGDTHFHVYAMDSQDVKKFLHETLGAYPRRSEGDGAQLSLR
jgi:hypothetical protein